jgi:trimethylamine:corrinoid methyltransferase-like protein
MEARAAKEVDRILENHQPEPLPVDVQRDLKTILERQQASAQHK